MTQPSNAIALRSHPMLAQGYKGRPLGIALAPNLCETGKYVSSRGNWFGYGRDVVPQIAEPLAFVLRAICGRNMSRYLLKRK